MASGEIVSRVGIGSNRPKIVVYIANRPDLDDFQHDVYRALNYGEAAEIIKLTSNHWRKVFSILAKISFALFDTGCQTWQEYRDTKLLTKDGFEALCFNDFQKVTKTEHFSIISGFTYAQTQIELSSLIPHQKYEKLLISQQQNLIVTPYFDWRQLNNELLAVVIEILHHKLNK